MPAPQPHWVLNQAFKCNNDSLSFTFSDKSKTPMLYSGVCLVAALFSLLRVRANAQSEPE